MESYACTLVSIKGDVIINEDFDAFALPGPVSEDETSVV